MTKFISPSRLIGEVVTVAILFCVPIVHAQGKLEEKKQEQKSEITDKDLRSFAKSYIEFHKIRTEYEPALAKAADPNEKNKIEQEAVAKFSKAVAKQGLTLESYARIFQAVNANEQLRDKALNLVDEERKRS